MVTDGDFWVNNHLLGLDRLYQVTRVPDVDFGEMTIYLAFIVVRSCTASTLVSYFWKKNHILGIYRMYPEHPVN